MPFASNKNLIANKSKEEPEFEEGIEDENEDEDEDENGDESEEEIDKVESINLVGEIYKIDGKDWADEFKFIDKEGNEYFVTSNKEFLSEDIKDALIYRIIGEKKGNKISLDNYEVLAEDWASYENKLVKENQIQEIKTDIKNKVTNEYSGASIKEIQIEDNIATEDEAGYIVLSYLKWDVENDAEMTKKMLEEYSDDLGATLVKHESIREITIFWEVPYHLEDANIAKMIYTRNGDMMDIGEK